MSTVNLRHIITEKVSLIDDEVLLQEIKTLIDSKVSSTIYKLSSIQNDRIKFGTNQIRKEQTVSNKGLQKEIRQWLNTK